MKLHHPFKVLAKLAVLSLAATTASAQILRTIPDSFLDRSLSTDDAIHFCLNSASALMEFDRAVGGYLADLALMPAEFHELTYPATPFPYEYNLSLPEEELFIQLTNNCDALLGFPLPEMGSIYPWLTVTAPYYQPRFVLALGAGSPDSLRDLPPGSKVGSRIGLDADAYVRLRLPEAGRELKRRVYPTNQAMIAELESGVLPAAIIWQPAIALAVQSDPAAGEVRVLDPPFAVSPIRFTVAVPSNQTYLRQLLDDAIAEFRTKGGLRDLLAQFGLPEE